MRGVLGIDDRDVDAQIALQRREMALDRLSPGAPNDIAAQKDVHVARARFRLCKLRFRKFQRWLPRFTEPEFDVRSHDGLAVGNFARS
jgi:hypothetical protein